MTFIYSWLPAYQQIVAKLPAYRNRQIELIQVLRDIGVIVNDDEDIRGTKSPLTEIDPFTFLFFLAKTKNDWNRVVTIRKLCELWNIDVLVNDVCGLPGPNPQKLWMFPYKYDRTTEIEDLWKFFDSACREAITDPQFETIRNIKSVGLQKMTEGLFMVKPYRYLCLNSKVKPYIQTFGIKPDFETYSQLETIYTEIKAKIPLSFPDISFKGYISTSTKDHVPSYFRIGTKEGESGESQLPNMITNSIASIGWSDIGNLNEFKTLSKGAIINAFQDAGYRNAANVQSRKAGEILVFKNDIVAGDYVLAADGAKIKAIGKVISNHYVFDPHLTFAHCRCVEWIKTDIEDFSVDEGLRTSVWKYYNEPNIQSIKAYIQKVEGAETPPHEPNNNVGNNQNELQNMSLNQILYGPPGTGKTFHSISHSVAIIEGLSADEIVRQRDNNVRDQNGLTVKDRYDKYINEGRVQFCTFHQSMSYEDFIEGIKPLPPEQEDKFLKYAVKPGMFTNICTMARSSYVENFNKKIAVETAFEPLYNRYKQWVTTQLANGEEVIVYTKDNVQYKIKSIDDDSVILNKLGVNVDKIVKKSKLQTLADAFSDITILNNFSKQFRKHIGGNTTISWAVLNAIKIHKSQEEAEKIDIEDLTNEHYKAYNTSRFVLIIDEINRGNVSQIFGELITLIEDDKRLGKNEALTVTMPYSGDEFGVPPNVYIIGTMNTADRSVEALDTALRRRFTFVPMMPDEGKLTAEFDGVVMRKILATLNERLRILKDSDHTIGHAWLMGVDDLDGLMAVFGDKILPLLQEYFYNDYEKLGLVLGDKFFAPHTRVKGKELASFTGSASLAGQYKNMWIYKLKKSADLDADAFLSLCEEPPADEK